MITNYPNTAPGGVAGAAPSARVQRATERTVYLQCHLHGTKEFYDRILRGTVG